jgi:hypothetical protein
MDGKDKNETYHTVERGGGDILFTPEDLCKFLNALFQGKLVSQSTLEKMKTIKDGYGLGIVKFPFGQRWAYGHNGNIDGFESVCG